MQIAKFAYALICSLVLKIIYNRDKMFIYKISGDKNGQS